MSPILQSLANGSARGYGAFVPLGAAGAFESIASASGTGSSGTITFSSIPQTYQHLQIRINATVDAAGSWVYLNEFAGNTGNNYAFHNLAGDGASALAEGNFSQNKILCWRSGNYLQTSQPATFIIDIQDYASTTRAKTVRFISGQDVNGSGGLITIGSGLFNSTTAISSLKVTTGGVSNFTTSSTFALYGIKGA